MKWKWDRPEGEVLESAGQDKMLCCYLEKEHAFRLVMREYLLDRLI